MLVVGLRGIRNLSNFEVDPPLVAQLIEQGMHANISELRAVVLKQEPPHV
jgi:hypothetical protein